MESLPHFNSFFAHDLGMFHDDVVHGPARTVQADGSYEDNTWEEGVNTGTIIDASRAADRADKGI